MEPIAVSLGAGATSFTLGSTLGQVLYLKIVGNAGALKPISFSYYVNWKLTDADESGTITHYIRLGRDSSRNFKFRPWPSPSSATDLEGHAKKRLTAYTSATFATATELEFFPTEVQDILVEGVSSDIKAMQGKTQESALLSGLFEGMIKDLIAEEQKNKPDESPRTFAPEYFRRRSKLRGHGTTVV